MPWIPLYADESDFRLIFERLNNDPEIAVIVSNGRNKWIAHNQIDNLPDGRYCLWHVPSGKLPLFKEGKVDVLGKDLRSRLNIPGRMLVEAGWVKDPFKGWKEARKFADSRIPFFGSIPGEIELCVRSKGVESSNSIGLSAFGWIGNRYRSIGKPAKKETVNWWRRLNRWVSRVTVSKIPRCGPVDGPNPEIGAFPSAYQKILAGVNRDTNTAH